MPVPIRSALSVVTGSQAVTQGPGDNWDPIYKEGLEVDRCLEKAREKLISEP